MVIITQWWCWRWTKSSAITRKTKYIYDKQMHQAPLNIFKNISEMVNPMVLYTYYIVILFWIHAPFYYRWKIIFRFRLTSAPSLIKLTQFDLVDQRWRWNHLFIPSDLYTLLSYCNIATLHTAQQCAISTLPIILGDHNSMMMLMVDKNLSIN